MFTSGRNREVPGDNEDSCPGSEQEVAPDGGGPRWEQGSARCVAEDPVVPAQPCAHCSLQPGRKQLMEMFLQHHQFPTISSSSLT